MQDFCKPDQIVVAKKQAESGDDGLSREGHGKDLGSNLKTLYHALQIQVLQRLSSKTCVDPET